MNRRKFLAWLTGTAAGVALAPTLDLDKLLWIPGEKKIFIPEIVPSVITAGGTLARGDVFTIAGVFVTNWKTGKATTELQKFVVTADITSETVPTFKVESIFRREHERASQWNIEPL